jgi:DNA-binding Lrp family transcriptional regulator
MPAAYVLLNTEIGAERDVLNFVRKIEGVQDAFKVLGIYDIIAHVKADTMDTLLSIIKSLQINKVITKLTIVLSEK